MNAYDHGVRCAVHLIGCEGRSTGDAPTESGGSEHAGMGRSHRHASIDEALEDDESESAQAGGGEAAQEGGADADAAEPTLGPMEAEADIDDGNDGSNDNKKQY